MIISMRPKGQREGKALELEMTPYVWGEDYQERSIWHIELPDANLASVEDLEFEIAFQGEILSRANVLPWDDDLGRPLHVDKTLVNLKKANSIIAKQKKAIEKMKNSRSWRYAKVLRRLSVHS